VFVDDVNLNDKKNAFDSITQEKIVDTGLHVTGFGIIFYKRDMRTDEEFWNQEFGEK